MRACPVDGTPLTGRADQRYCSERCSKKARRARVVNLDAARPEPTSDGPMTRQIRAELEAAGRTDSWLAASALMLAGRLDSGQEPGTAVKGLNAELRATMAEALRGVARSSVSAMRDELAERRRRA